MEKKMKKLIEIHRDKGLNLTGRTLERESAKAIIWRGGKLLLVNSSIRDGYKFPGGGVKPGESFEETLTREILEECGARLLHILGEFGIVIENKLPFEPEYEVFKMTSRYYLCQVGDGLGEQCLDDYEQELGYRPQWVDIEYAIQTNRWLSSQTEANVPGWLVRETYILELVRQQVISSGFFTPDAPAPPVSDPP